MRPPADHPPRILAIAPRSRGFGYAVLEGHDRLIDWGTRGTRTDKRVRTWRSTASLIDAFRPDLLVVEAAHDDASRRAPRIRRLIADVTNRAGKRGLKTAEVPLSEVRTCFRSLHAYNKHEIAHALAVRFPELTPRLPPHREPWMSEDERLSIFDAAALAVTHLQSNT